jgi:hypothetical protein
LKLGPISLQDSITLWMADSGTYVNSKLQTAVPWGDLLSSSHLQTILHAIVQRIDRQEALFSSQLAGGKGPEANAQSKLTVSYWTSSGKPNRIGSP